MFEFILVVAMADTPMQTLDSLVGRSDIVVEGAIHSCALQARQYHCTLKIGRVFKGNVSTSATLCGSSVSNEAPKLPTYEGLHNFFFLRYGEDCLRLFNNEYKGIARVVNERVHASVEPYSPEGIPIGEFEKSIQRVVESK